MILGVHVSTSGSVYEAIDRAEALGCTAMQIFSRNPRQWRKSTLPQEDIREFRSRRQKSGIKAVAVHMPYLTNLATGYDVLYKESIEAYVEDLFEASALGAEYLVTHLGSYKNSTEREGLGRFIKAINTIFSETKGNKVKLLLENTAGSGRWLGADFDHHKKIFDGVKENSRLGVCLDTAHLFAAGFNIAKTNVFDAVLRQIDSKLGKKALRLVHLNDSMTPLGSHADRHEHIGKGFIGIKGIKHIVNHKRLKEVPFILETPKNGPKEDQMNLDRVRSLLKDGV